MEKIKYKKEKFIKSLNALEKTGNIFSRENLEEDVKEILVASYVKHFEMCYESAWKFLQVYLEIKHNQLLSSPKKIFRECFTLNLVDQKTTQDLLDISEARNSTVHDYDQETAQETCKRINQYYLVFKNLENII